MALQQADHRQSINVHRRQFNRQWQPIEPSTDVTHSVEVLFAQGKTLLAGAGAAGRGWSS